MHSDKLPITGPCPIDLDDTDFDRSAKRAFCGHCRKNVFNLSNMTRDEARSLLREHAGQKICVSYGKASDGAIRFRPSPPPADLVPVGRLSVRPSRSAMAAAAAGLAVALAACTPHGKEQDEVGKIEVVDPEPADGDPTRTIPWADPDSNRDPVPAGMAMVPDDIVEGEISVPTVDDVAEPCDKPEVEPEPEPRPPQKLRGRIRVRDIDEL